MSDCLASCQVLEIAPWYTKLSSLLIWLLDLKLGASHGRGCVILGLRPTRHPYSASLNEDLVDNLDV